MRDPDELSETDLGGYAEEFKIEPAKAPPAKERGPGGSLGLFAEILERPVRNGLIASAIGALVAFLSVAAAFAAGGYLPFLLVIGSGMVPVGLAIAALPMPKNARDKLLGKDKSGGAGWFLWQLAVFVAFLIGGGGGLLVHIWLSA